MADFACRAARDLPIATDETWDGAAAKASIFKWAGFDGDSPDGTKAAKGFLIVDTADFTLKGSFHLPFALVSNGTLKASPAGIRAAASRLPQMHGLSSEMEAKARAVIDHYEKKMGMGDSSSQNAAGFAIWHKSFDSRVEKQANVGDSDMELINEFALEPLTADQVYITRQHLCNDQVDRSYERFTKKVLQRFAETLPGKPVLTGHDKTMVPAGTYIDAKIVRDSEGVHHLKTRSFTLASDPLTEKIKAGIAGKVSIGFRAAKRTCDLCGKDYDAPGRDPCDHLAGQEYEGKTCTLTYDGDLNQYEALEGSYVPFPCQYGAQTIRRGAAYDHAVKAASLAGAPAGSDAKGREQMDLEKALAEIERLTARVKELEKNEPLVEDGKAFRAWLKSEITRLAGITKNEDLAAVMIDSADTAPIAKLKGYHDTLWKKVDELYPPKGDGIPAPPADQTKVTADPPPGRWRPSYAVTPRS